MKEDNTKRERKKRVGVIKRVVLFGVVSVALYIVVFLNQEAVTDHLTRGGGYAVVVIVTALIFSLIHGSFANYLLELLGIQPSKGGGH